MSQRVSGFIVVPCSGASPGQDNRSEEFAPDCPVQEVVELDGPKGRLRRVQASTSAWLTSPSSTPRSLSQAEEGNGGQQVRLRVAGSGARPGCAGGSWLWLGATPARWR